MWYLLYNVLLLLASPVILLVLLAKKRCRRGLLQRLGRLPARLRHDGRPVVWIHAVSLGEAVAIVPLVRALRHRFPGHRMVVSTVTETGREAVEQRLEGLAEHCYAPLDFPWAVAKVVRFLRPSAFLFVETELWPNLLRALFRSGVPSILINGRLSSRSFGRYRVVRPFLRQVLGYVASCLMQSDRDVERIIALGAPPDRVVRTGNIKFDQPVAAGAGPQAGPTRAVMGVAPAADLLVAGSTHPGEEEQLLACFGALRREFPALVMVLAPRHIERVAEVEAVVRQAGFSVRRRSAAGSAAPTDVVDVVILDTRGELASLYREATVAYVGGTLAPVGGHNLLEPAQWGKAVFFGPHTDHCAEVADLLLRAGGAIRVADGADLAAAIASRLRDRATLDQMGLAAKRVVEENRGAVDRSLAVITEALDRQEAGGVLASGRRTVPHYHELTATRRP
jgi:3-deoxy-D-manno-octulosonic-acid transferase